MSNEAEWCLDGDQDDSEVALVEEVIPNKPLQSQFLDKPQVDTKVKASEEVASVGEGVASEEAFGATEAALLEEVVLAIKIVVASVVDRVGMVVVLPKVLPVVQVAEVVTAVQMATRIGEMATEEVGMEAEIEVVRLGATENLSVAETEDMKTETDMVVAEETKTTDRESDITRMMGTMTQGSGVTKRRTGGNLQHCFTSSLGGGLVGIDPFHFFISAFRIKGKTRHPKHLVLSYLSRMSAFQVTGKEGYQEACDHSLAHRGL